jgi:hypothetical protein
MVVPSPPPAVTAPCSPACTFERMQRAVNNLTEPSYIAFTFQDEEELESSYGQELLRVLVRNVDGNAVMTVIRDIRGDTIEHPFAQVVANRDDFLYVSRVLRLGDFPLADFGLRYVRPARPDFFESTEPQSTAKPSSLKVITTVYATGDLPYSVVDRGLVSIDGQMTNHLVLTPIRYPKHNVLREIWIDTTTNLPVRYLAQRFVEDYPGDYYSYLITVDAREIDGHLVNVSAHGNNLHLHGISKWSISDLSFPASEPDWVFNRAQWRAHDGEPIPNLAPSQPPP